MCTPQCRQGTSTQSTGHPRGRTRGAPLATGRYCMFEPPDVFEIHFLGSSGHPECARQVGKAKWPGRRGHRLSGLTLDVRVRTLVRIPTLTRPWVGLPCVTTYQVSKIAHLKPKTPCSLQLRGYGRRTGRLAGWQAGPFADAPRRLQSGTSLPPATPLGRGLSSKQSGRLRSCLATQGTDQFLSRCDRFPMITRKGAPPIRSTVVSASSWSAITSRASSKSRP